MNYIDLPRMAYYVDKATFPKRGQFPHRQTEKGGVMQDIDTVLLNFSPASLNLLNAILAIVMFSIALDLKPADFRALVRAPKPLLTGPGLAIRRPAGRHLPVHSGGRAAPLHRARTDPRRGLSGRQHLQLHHPSRRRQHRAVGFDDRDRHGLGDCRDTVQHRLVGQPLRADAPDPARNRHRSGDGGDHRSS
jgi:hypothetical protein